MGPDGSGKSNFIDALSRREAAKQLNGNLRRPFCQVQPIVLSAQEGRQLAFVEFPGFDGKADAGTNAVALRAINDWLEEAFTNSVVIAGVLYMHSISDSRTSSRASRSLRIFQALCGDTALPRTMMITSGWDLAESAGQKRERALKEKYWKDLLNAGSHYARFNNTSDDAWSIVNNLMNNLGKNRGEMLLIYRETQELKLKLSETRVGTILLDLVKLTTQKTNLAAVLDGWENLMAGGEPKRLLGWYHRLASLLGPEKLWGNIRDMGRKTNRRRALDQSKVAPMELYPMVLSIARNPETRRFIGSLKGEDARNLVEYLDEILRTHHTVAHRDRRYLLALLCQCAFSAVVYPSTYSIGKSLALDSKSVSARENHTLHRGQYRNRVFCVKVLPKFPSLSAEELWKVRVHIREVVLWSHLHHSNILPFFGVWRHNSLTLRVGIVSPWLENQGLREYLQTRSDVPRLPLLSDVAEGLDYLHQHEIIHGDIRMPNILVSDEGRAQIMDFKSSVVSFGANQQSLDGSNYSGVPSPYWTAPELLRVKGYRSPTKPSDVWSFACLTYEERRPFYQYTNPWSACFAMAQEEAIPIRPLPSGITDELWELLASCWNYMPNSRPEVRVIRNFLIRTIALDNRPRAQNFGDILHVRENLRAASHRRYIEYQRLNDILQKFVAGFPELHISNVGIDNDSENNFSANSAVLGEDRASSILSTVDIELVDDETASDADHFSVLRRQLVDVLREADPKVTLFALSKLNQNDTQTMADFIDSVLREARIPAVLRPPILRMLCKLASSTGVYARSYELGSVQYNVQDCIGQGGYANVYRGTHQDRVICVKVFRQAQDTPSWNAYVKELTMWAHLSHPNILTFYGVYVTRESSPQLALVSPYMRNGNLHEYARSLVPDERLPLVRLPSFWPVMITEIPVLLKIYDVIKGLLYLHELGIVHGDLKGIQNNVLVSDAKRALITDFGNSHIASASQPATEGITTSPIAYTARWAAPELLVATQNLRPRRPCDIWSLGCLCYEILSGQLPFHRYATSWAVMAAITMRRETPISQGRDCDVIPGWMWDLMEQCWEFEPLLRASCKDILMFMARFGVQSTQSITGDADGFSNRGENPHKTELDLPHVEEVMRRILISRLPFPELGRLVKLSRPYKQELFQYDRPRKLQPSTAKLLTLLMNRVTHIPTGDTLTPHPSTFMDPDGLLFFSVHPGIGQHHVSLSCTMINQVLLNWLAGNASHEHFFSDIHCAMSKPFPDSSPLKRLGEAIKHRLRKNRPRPLSEPRILTASISDSSTSTHLSQITPDASNEQNNSPLVSGEITGHAAHMLSVGETSVEEASVVLGPRESTELPVGLNQPGNSVSLFQGASNFVIQNSTFVVSPISTDSEKKVAMNRLMEARMPGGELDSSARIPQPLCHPGTRNALRRRITAWINNPNREVNLLWIHGPAGVGKSAIAQTIGQYCKDLGWLGTAFFFSRPNNRDDPSKLIPTLAYQLSSSSPAYQRYIVRLLTDEPTILEKVIQTQFTKLLTEPLFHIQREAQSKEAIVMVLDGLDECKSDAAQRLAYTFSGSLRVDQNGRSLPFLRTKDHPVKCQQEKLAIQSQDAEDDVALFLRDEFHQILEKYTGDVFSTGTKWPSKSQFATIRGLASGLFVFASTVLKFVDDDAIGNPKTQLNLCLEFLKGGNLLAGSDPLDPLHSLYSGILRSIHPATLSTTLHVLSFSLLTRPSWPCQGAANLLRLKQAEFYASLRRLHSVLLIPSPDLASIFPIQPLHGSFLEFIKRMIHSGAFNIWENDIEKHLHGCCNHWIVEWSNVRSSAEIRKENEEEIMPWYYRNSFSDAITFSAELLKDLWRNGTEEKMEDLVTSICNFNLADFQAAFGEPLLPLTPLDPGTLTSLLVKLHIWQDKVETLIGYSLVRTEAKCEMDRKILQEFSPLIQFNGMEAGNVEWIAQGVEDWNYKTITHRDNIPALRTFWTIRDAFLNPRPMYFLLGYETRTCLVVAFRSKISVRDYLGESFRLFRLSYPKVFAGLKPEAWPSQEDLEIISSISSKTIIGVDDPSSHIRKVVAFIGNPIFGDPVTQLERIIRSIKGEQDVIGMLYASYKYNLSRFSPAGIRAFKEIVIVLQTYPTNHRYHILIQEVVPWLSGTLSGNDTNDILQLLNSMMSSIPLLFPVKEIIDVDPTELGSMVVEDEELWEHISLRYIQMYERGLLYMQRNISGTYFLFNNCWFAFDRALSSVVGFHKFLQELKQFPFSCLDTFFPVLTGKPLDSFCAVIGRLWKIHHPFKLQVSQDIGELMVRTDRVYSSDNELLSKWGRPETGGETMALPSDLDDIFRVQFITPRSKPFPNDSDTGKISQCFLLGYENNSCLVIATSYRSIFKNSHGVFQILATDLKQMDEFEDHSRNPETRVEYSMKQWKELSSILGDDKELRKIAALCDEGDPIAEKLVRAAHEVTLRQIRRTPKKVNIKQGSASSPPTRFGQSGQIRYERLVLGRYVTETEASGRSADPIPEGSNGDRILDRDYTVIRKGLLSIYRMTSMIPPGRWLNGEIIRLGSSPTSSGLFGDVWLGLWLEEKKVGLKELPFTRKDDDSFERLVREMEVWSKLDSRNIFRFYGYVDDILVGDQVCLVSPWFDNGNVLQ
ncbi:hypothetical protein NP233_g5540 [Leucocoprinus birnbaumii]|uniref:Protein kinase domain-containing protein n=1 Tax=Leucocoprinus birnbaumii TaxID=56174 RepID=A0AAD5VSN9_9AGAR|nr:hypothetical protein NP233_g5540 [Leucocoprinus birnbaumii]